MIYANILKELIQEESNPVRKMYLNELILSWKKSLVHLESEYTDTTLEEFMNSLNSHLTLLKNPKFLYHPREAENGFKANHPIFGPIFIRDLVNLMLKPTGLLINPALQIEFQSFNYNMHLKSMSFVDTLIRHQISFECSDPVYSVCMKMDLQYKPGNKKMFTKEAFNYPLMIFFVFRNFGKAEFNQVELVKQQIQSSNPNAFLSVLTETVDKNSMNVIANHKHDLFILKKSFNNNAETGYSFDVVKALQSKIFEYIKEKHIEFPDFVKTGYYNPQPEILSETPINPQPVTHKPPRRYYNNHKRRNNEQSSDK